MSASAPAGGMAWHEELASLVGDSGIRMPSPPEPVAPNGGGDGWKVVGEGYDFGFGAARPEEESFMDQVRGFAASTAEMARELGRAIRDVAAQSLAEAENSDVVRRIRGPASSAAKRLQFLNEYLPEDRSPRHCWAVVAAVAFLSVLVLNVGTVDKVPVEQPRKLYISPPCATRIQLPDGRYLAYREQGVSPERARYSLIAPHSFLSSRLAGIPGISTSLLEEFGARLITYDLPGFGESDPHSGRNLNSSASDMLHLSEALDIVDKFWVVGYSGGGMHAWAAAYYIPEKLAGLAMFAPIANPYDPSITKEERHKILEKWTPKRKFMFTLARKLPAFLPWFYRRSFLAGKQGELTKWLSLSLGKKDKSLLEERAFRELWERDVAESVRQGDAGPFVEEAVLQVSDWGFKLSDIQVQRHKEGKGFFHWLKSMYSQVEREWTGFLGPIHIWQGMDDWVVPPSTTDFVRRVVPGATVHKLLGEGHFSYFWLCDECHRQIFSTLFGIPQGPLNLPDPPADNPLPESPQEADETTEQV